jgi:hypothetical protein
MNAKKIQCKLILHELWARILPEYLPLLGCGRVTFAKEPLASLKVRKFSMGLQRITCVKTNRRCLIILIKEKMVSFREENWYMTF